MDFLNVSITSGLIFSFIMIVTGSPATTLSMKKMTNTMPIKTGMVIRTRRRMYLPISASRFPALLANSKIQFVQGANFWIGLPFGVF